MPARTDGKPRQAHRQTAEQIEAMRVDVLDTLTKAGGSVSNGKRTTTTLQAMMSSERKLVGGGLLKFLQRMERDGLVVLEKSDRYLTSVSLPNGVRAEPVEEVAAEPDLDLIDPAAGDSPTLAEPERELVTAGGGR